MVYDSAAHFILTSQEGNCNVRLATYTKFRNRLAADMVAFFQGKRPAPVLSEYNLPWYYHIIFWLPVTLPVLTLGDRLSAVPASLFMMGSMYVGHQEKWGKPLRHGILAGLTGITLLLMLLAALQLPNRINVLFPRHGYENFPQNKTAYPVRSDRAPERPMARPQTPSPPPPPPPARPKPIESVPDAAAALDSGQWPRQNEALEWLKTGKLDNPQELDQIMPPLARLIKSQSTPGSVSNSALQLYCRLARTQDLPVLETFARDDSSRMSSMSIEPVLRALVRLDASVACRVIEERSSDTFFSMRAVSALSELGADQEKSILPLLRSSSIPTRRIGCQVLGRIGTATSIPDIQKCVEGLPEGQEKFVLKATANAAVAEIRRRQGQ